MRSLSTATAAVTILAALAVARPAAADLNTYYKGTEWFEGKAYPASAQFSCGTGRVALALKGVRDFRMLLLEDQKMLRVVDDTKKECIDMPGGMGAGMTAEMEKQLEKVPAAQREMAKAMMEKMMPAATTLPANEYVVTDKHETIRGNLCTRVDVMREGHRHADYWATQCDSFRLTDDEVRSVALMHEYMGQSGFGEQTGGPASQAFVWDTKGGYPLRTHCYNGDTMTLELELAAFDRKPVDTSLFDVPKGYKQRSFSK